MSQQSLWRGMLTHPGVHYGLFARIVLPSLYNNYVNIQQI